jgi:hypothetical protein
LGEIRKGVDLRIVNKKIISDYLLNGNTKDRSPSNGRPFCKR